jgi:hypothetical protein
VIHVLSRILCTLCTIWNDVRVRCLHVERAIAFHVLCMTRMLYSYRMTLDQSNDAVGWLLTAGVLPLLPNTLSFHRNVDIFCFYYFCSCKRKTSIEVEMFVISMDMQIFLGISQKT